MIKLLPSNISELGKFTNSFRHSELGEKYFSSNQLIRKTFLEFLEQKTILTAKNSNDIVGYICHIPNGAFHSFPYIHILNIIPEYRGNGYGRQILKIFEKQYIGDSTKIFLVVADFNPKAKSFYEKSGFIQIGKIPSLYRPNINEFLMMKSVQ